MYDLFIEDDQFDTHRRGHSILNFIDTDIKMHKMSAVDKSSNAVFYINQYSNYNRYDKFINRAANKKIVIDYSFESGLGQEYTIKILKHFESLGIPAKNVLFILNLSSKNFPELKNLNVFFIDYFAVDAVRRLKFDTFSRLKVHQRKPPRLNFLVAKLKKTSRFLTTYWFYKNQLLDQSIISLLCQHEDIIFHEKSFPEIEEEFYQEVQKYYGPKYNNLDKRNFGRNDVGDTYSGWPNDSRIYDRSSVSIVCETSERWTGWTSEFITEKTYRPIMNRHPFVIQGTPGMLKHLKSRGFRTFDEIIDESYDESRDINFEIVQKVCDQGLELSKKISKNTTLIQEIVDHNYENLVKIASEENQNLINCVLSHLKD